MNKGLFAALASVALLGASCSVQDFSTVVMDKPSITVDIDANAHGFGAPTDDGLMSLQNGDVITALYIGNPSSSSYYVGSSWVNLFSLTDGTDSFTFVAGPPNYELYNRLAVSTNGNAFFESVLMMPESLPKWNNTYCFGGNSSFVSGVDTTRNTILYFNKPLTVSAGEYALPVTDFACPLAHRSFEQGRSEVNFPILLQGVSSIEWTLTPGEGDSSTGAVNASSILSLFSSGLLDVQAFRAFCVGSASGQFDFTFTYANGSQKNILVAPVYVDVTSTSSSDVASPLIPIVTAVNRAAGSALSDIVFTTFFYGAYSGNIIRYVNAESQNQDRPDKVFNRLEVSLPSNQSFVSLNYIGILDGYAQGYIDGVAASGAEITDLTNRILSLEQMLAQYQGKSYQVIYNLGYQAGLDENAQGAATFNSLFGNILTAPLTILNGLTDISFFGMPILTAILSLLMVAMALFLFKRFK